jgi:hypothetical protein
MCSCLSLCTVEGATPEKFQEKMKKDEKSFWIQEKASNHGHHGGEYFPVAEGVISGMV